MDVDVVSEVLHPLLTSIVVTFLVTEVMKYIVKRTVGVTSDRWVIVFTVIVGILLAYGWTLSVLPKPTKPGFENVAAVLTGLIIAGAAAGVFSWMENLFPWFAQLKASNKEEVSRQ